MFLSLILSKQVPSTDKAFTEKCRKAPPFRAGDIRRDFALS